MSYEIPPTSVVSQTRSRVPIIVSWVVILGLVGTIVYMNAKAADSPANALVNDERARMFAMVAVQMKSLQGDAATPAVVRERMGELLGQMESDARTADDKIRVAILAGEMFGADAALKRLSNITGSDVSRDAAADVRTAQKIYEEQAGALSPEAKEALIRRHGYLGRLALAYGVPPNREPRRTLQSEAFWFTVKLSAVGVALVVLMGLSLVAFVVACVWFYRGKIQRAYIPKPSPGGPFLEGFTLYLVLFVSLSALLRYLKPVGIQGTWIALLILPAVWSWTVLRRTSPEERWQAFGWHRGRGVLREIGAGLGGYVAGLVVVAVGCLITVLLIRVTGNRASSPIIQELNGGPWRLVGLYALSCVFAPLMEETMFRGILFHHLRKRWSWLVSAAMVSLIFASLHPQGWVAIPALSAIAMVLAALREWRGSLIAPMAAHALSNFLVLTLALLLLR